MIPRNFWHLGKYWIRVCYAFVDLVISSTFLQGLSTVLFQWIDTFPKKTYSWLTDTWKDAHLHPASGKYKSKLQWDRAPGWLSWLSVWLLISAQVMILWFLGSNPMSGSVLTAWSLLGILSLPLCSSPTRVCTRSQKNFKKESVECENPTFLL